MDPKTTVPKNAQICIICHAEVMKTNAMLKIKEDSVINTIRKIKKTLGIAQNNTLYVCEKDGETYQKKRKQFENDLIVYGGVAVVLFIFLTGLPLLSGRFDVRLFASSLFLSGLIVVFIVLFRYVPDVEKNARVIPSPKAEMPEKKITKRKRG